MTVIVKKIGGSVGIVIPKQVAHEMELRNGTSLSMTARGDEIVMRKEGRRPRRSIRQIVSKIKPGSYRARHQEFSGDKPAGKEIW